MARLRSVNTHFWKDSFVADLDPIEKLLFLYLLTNPSASLAGCFELSLREMAFDTGVDKDMIVKILARLETDRKVVYKQGWIVLLNFLKHQSFNANMGKAAAKELNVAPEWVRRLVGDSLKGFGILPEWFGMVKGREGNRREDEVEGNTREGDQDCAFGSTDPEQIHLDEILEGLRTRYGLNSLRDEQGWCTAATWAYVNKFSVAEFLSCFDSLRSQPWRKGRLTPENVANNLPELRKTVTPAPTRKTAREYHAEATAIMERDRAAV